MSLKRSTTEFEKPSRDRSVSSATLNIVTERRVAVSTSKTNAPVDGIPFAHVDPTEYIGTTIAIKNAMMKDDPPGPLLSRPSISFPLDKAEAGSPDFGTASAAFESVLETAAEQYEDADESETPFFDTYSSPVQVEELVLSRDSVRKRLVTDNCL